jgi:tRNA(fMet)-specific endonuclease VapC
MMMLDSNIAIRLIRRDPKIIGEFLKHEYESIGISSVVFYELEVGVILKKISKANQQATRDFLEAVQVFDFGAKAAAIAAELAAKRANSGKVVGTEDTFIAAHAIAVNAVLVTANTKHFEGIPGLQLADWSK